MEVEVLDYPLLNSCAIPSFWFDWLTLIFPFSDQLNPVSSAYAHYDQSATFSDPIGIAEGLEKVKSQFK